MNIAPRRWAVPALAVAAAGAAVALPLVSGSTDRASAADGALESFPTCSALASYAAHATMAEMTRVMPMDARKTPSMPSAAAADSGAEALASAPQSATPRSETNVQVAGIDEPDIVKTDGRRIFALAGGRLYAVDATGDRPRVTGTLRFADGLQPAALILSGDRLLVIGTVWQQEGARSRPAPDVSSPGTVAKDAVYAGMPRTVLISVDVGRPDHMRVADRMSTDAAYSTARLSDGTVRVVLTGPQPPYPVVPGTGLAGTVEQTLALRRMTALPASSWLPSFRREDATGRATAADTSPPCTSVSRPADGSDGTSTVTVLTIDPAQGVTPVDEDTIMGAADQTMLSADNLYVTSARTGTNGRVTTHIHVFDVSRPRSTDYRASGSVEGTPLSQFSMDEHAGVLRVATTRPSDIAMPMEDTDGTRPAESDSMVTTLRVEGRRLVELGRVDGLGRGEQIYAVRFMGGRGYVVTFRQTDPLYTIDLSDPRAPRMTGELKINGYSAYLHPVDDDHVIGVGQDGDGQGGRTGAQVSLFDVSDPASPRRVASWSAPGAYSDVEWDHHAFLWWAPTSTAVIPVVSTDPGDGTTRDASAVALHITPEGIDGVKGLAQGPATAGGRSPILRSLVIGDTLYTVSDTGIVARGVSTLDDGTWVPFG